MLDRFKGTQRTQAAHAFRRRGPCFTWNCGSSARSFLCSALEFVDDKPTTDIDGSSCGKGHEHAIPSRCTVNWQKLRNCSASADCDVDYVNLTRRPDRRSELLSLRRSIFWS